MGQRPCVIRQTPIVASVLGQLACLSRFALACTQPSLIAGDLESDFFEKMQSIVKSHDVIDKSRRQPEAKPNESH